MTLRKQYICWIVLEQWNTPDGKRIPEFPQTRGTDLHTFRLVCTDALSSMSEQRVRQVRDDAGLWFYHLNPRRQKELLAKYNVLPPPVHGVWQKSVENLRSSAV